MLGCFVYTCSEPRSKISTLSEGVPSYPRRANTLSSLYSTSRFPYALPSSVSRKSCICHSCENCRVWGYSSRFGKVCAVAPRRTRISFKLFLFTFLRTLLHAAKFNSFLFKRLRTLCPKTPGVGVPLSFQITHIWYSGKPKMISSCPLLPQNITRKRTSTP